MLVDLVTPERDLEDLMLKKYPGEIFEEQVAKSGEGKNKVFYFLGFDYESLSEFLVKNKCTGYRYSILDENSRLIEENNTFHNPVHH